MKVLKSGKKCSLSLWERAGVRAMSKGLTNTARMLRKKPDRCRKGALA
jgi:hypothetical protein